MSDVCVHVCVDALIGSRWVGEDLYNGHLGPSGLFIATQQLSEPAGPLACFHRPQTFFRLWDKEVPRERDKMEDGQAQWL